MLDKYREEIGRVASQLDGEHSADAISQWLDDLLERALAEQREGISQRLRVTIGDLDGESQWLDGFRQGVHESADIARTYGQTGEDA